MRQINALPSFTLYTEMSTKKSPVTLINSVVMGDRFNGHVFTRKLFGNLEGTRNKASCEGMLAVLIQPLTIMRRRSAYFNIETI